jgi:hypothetical protein
MFIGAVVCSFLFLWCLCQALLSEWSCWSVICHRSLYSPLFSGRVLRSLLLIILEIFGRIHLWRHLILGIFFVERFFWLLILSPYLLFVQVFYSFLDSALEDWKVCASGNSRFSNFLMIVAHISHLWVFFFFFFAVPGLNTGPIPWATPPALFSDGFFW